MQENLFKSTHKNHFLFSDHYLNDILPKQEIWAKTTGLDEAYIKIRKLYKNVRENLEASNEAQLEKDFIQPILKILRHYFEVQAPLHGTGELIRPDYSFFINDEERKTAKKIQGKKEYFERTIAIGDAKSWDRTLDRRIKSRKSLEDIGNPSVQINNYLMRTGQKWGVLTNGRLWRLYNRETSFSVDSFYEIDLVKLIGQDTSEAFKYFYLLFRRQAFEIYDTKPTFLDFVYDESTSYTVAVQKDLKEHVYEALRILANGFLKYPRNNLDPIRDKNAIHDNCLILLYRLLFIFYAEVRGLMPDNNEYRNSFSFDLLKKQIRERKRRGESISPVTTEYWGKLKELFMLINDPMGMYDMPQYNGGLFNPENHPFLEKCTIGDQTMANDFDCIACTTTKEGTVFVDYRDLEVQHLGSIYEGLLEYKLEYADQDKVVVKGKKKKEIVENKADHPELPIAYHKGEYFLITDKGERKATGSYYTPDYIVRYIVENTLQPLVDRCKDYQEILDLNILDPAMGSGHFLVGVVDFLAEQILYHPTTPLLEEGDEDKEIAHWRRRVVERCVYGVDINPLAVELAKLSLWLHTVAYGKPLSFLDHHLRCGNSLIGAKVKDLHELPDVKKKKKTIPEWAGKQITTIEPLFLQKVSLAVGHYLLIEQMETRSKEDIDKKEDLLKIAEAHLHQFKEIANVWVSAYFGNELNRDDYHQLLEALHSKRFSDLQSLAFFKQAQELAVEKRFFHWEMEFPDVFFDRHGRWLDNPGFDGVVGNPPYGPISNLTKEMQEYLEVRFADVYSGNSDILFYFIPKGLVLLAQENRLGLIVARYFMEAKFGENLRKYILKNAKIRKIVDFQNFQVFGKEVSVLANILVLETFRGGNFENVIEIRKVINEKTPESMVEKTLLEKEKLERVFYIFPLKQSYLKKQAWNLIHQEAQDIKRKMYSDSDLLGAICTISKTWDTGCREAFIVTGEYARVRHLESNLLKPFINNADVYPYYIDFQDQYMIFTDNVENIKIYPNVHEHLDQFRDILEKRFDIRNRNGKWFELSNLRNKDLFLSANRSIVVPIYATYNRFAIDDVGYANEGGGLRVIILKEGVQYDYGYIICLLNSNLMTFFHRHTGKLKRAGYYEYINASLEEYPIKRVVCVEDSRNHKKIVNKIIDSFCEEEFTAALSKIQGCFKDRVYLIHDLLSRLAIVITEAKRKRAEEITRFLDWLELNMGLNVNELGRTFFNNYYEKDNEEFFGYLRKRKVSITYAQTSEIKEQFEHSVSIIKPLISNIEKTDWLIDHIVYRLYGLTEEEIRVVEESL